MGKPKAWREYETQVHEHFKRKYPDKEILFNQKVPGRHSRVARQVDVLVKFEVAGVESIGAFDCKHFQDNVDVHVIDGMVGFLDDLSAPLGGVVSSRGFSQAATNRARAALPTIDLRVIPFVSAEDLVDKLVPSGLMYGEGHAFFFDAPAGWVLDNRRGVDQGTHAVFYPRGSSWKDAPAVMYVKTTRRDATDELEAFIAQDVEQFRSKNPGLMVSSGMPLVTADNKRAEIRHFSGGARGNIETVAYIKEDAVFVLLVLTARTQPSYVDALPAHSQLVNSYAFFTKDVRILHGPPGS
jgi:hypothetical protein